MGIVTSRGCSGKCTFCARVVFGNRLRAFSAERLLQLFDVLKKDYSIDGVVINDDNFVVFKKRLRSVCEELSRRHERFLWSCFARVDQVDADTLSLMYAAGCRSISFGIESGSQRMLDAMNKEITPAQAESAVRMAHNAGLFTTGYFILGFPGESQATIDETIRFANRLPLDNVLYSSATPYPGTQFYETVKGAAEMDWQRFSQWETTYVPDGMTAAELESSLARAMSSFYLRPRIWTRHAGRAVREGLVGGYVTEALGVACHMVRARLHGN